MDRYTTEFQGDQKHTHLDLDFQVPNNNLTFYPHCKVLLEMEFSYKWNSKNRYGCKNSPYYWNSKNRSISKIGSTPGNTQIENFEKSAYFWNSQNWKIDQIYYINGIPKIVPFQK